LQEETDGVECGILLAEVHVLIHEEKNSHTYLAGDESKKSLSEKQIYYSEPIISRTKG
jgi:hypothetical protein